MNIQEIVQKDPRVAVIRQKYQQTIAERQQQVLSLSFCESDLIRKMGQFEFASKVGVDEDTGMDVYVKETTEILSVIKQLVTCKISTINAIVRLDDALKSAEKEFKALADVIVGEIQVAAGHPATPEPEKSCACAEGGQCVCDVCQCEDGCATDTVSPENEDDGFADAKVEDVEVIIPPTAENTRPVYDGE